MGNKWGEDDEEEFVLLPRGTKEDDMFYVGLLRGHVGEQRTDEQHPRDWIFEYEKNQKSVFFICCSFSSSPVMEQMHIII